MQSDTAPDTNGSDSSSYGWCQPQLLPSVVNIKGESDDGGRRCLASQSARQASLAYIAQARTALAAAAKRAQDSARKAA